MDSADPAVEGNTVGKVGKGLMVLVGVERSEFGRRRGTEDSCLPYRHCTDC
jgi:D-Tyr-tRNAtyr deacylase